LCTESQEQRIKLLEVERAELKVELAHTKKERNDARDHVHRLQTAIREVRNALNKWSS
jgi:uncharacterized protein YPO0396